MRASAPGTHARAVEVLDAHDVGAAGRARGQPRDERRARAAEVQVARRRRCEATAIACRSRLSRRIAASIAVVFDWMGAFVIAAVAGVPGGTAGARAARWTRLAARLPATRVGRARRGQAGQGGRRRRGAATTMPAPLTQRPCVGWTIRAVAADGGWVLDRIARSGACDFWLRDDDGGRVLRARRASGARASPPARRSRRRAKQGLVQREALLRARRPRHRHRHGAARARSGRRRRMYREPPTRLVLDGIPLWLLPASSVTRGRRIVAEKERQRLGGLEHQPLGRLAIVAAGGVGIRHPSAPARRRRRARPPRGRLRRRAGSCGRSCPRRCGRARP